MVMMGEKEREVSREQRPKVLTEKSSRKWMFIETSTLDS